MSSGIESLLALSAKDSVKRPPKLGSKAKSAALNPVKRQNSESNLIGRRSFWYKLALAGLVIGIFSFGLVKLGAKSIRQGSIGIEQVAKNTERKLNNSKAKRAIKLAFNQPSKLINAPTLAPKATKTPPSPNLKALHAPTAETKQSRSPVDLSRPQ